MPSFRIDRRFVRASVLGIVVLLAVSFLGGCGEDGAAETENGSAALPQGAEPFDLNPAEFTVEIDNPYWPMRPGSRWVYREADGEGGVQRVVVTVTEKTKRVANGVEARVVRDIVSDEGHPVEVTSDWYAQDAEGNLWYMGEQTAEYENGRVVTTAGSWEAGVDGAEPGVVIAAAPEPGNGLPAGVLRGRGGRRGRGLEHR